jgi:DNA repair exonuclease SbcCD nuclease subunit
MKIALVTDLHFGARSDSLSFDAHFKKFYEETFFPYLEENGIKTIFDLGDTFDRRKYINYNSLKSCKEYFFDRARDLGIDLHMIPGNHDTYYKNTNAVNSPNLLLREYDNITLYEEVTEIQMGKSKILFVPWICVDNYDSSIQKISESKADICLGHFEFSGYQMYRGSPNPHGMDPNLFSHLPTVISGHFHHRHTQKNITYMGNPYQITWSDWDDPRGFAVVDCDNQEVTYVNNPNQIFHKIYYDDSTDDGRKSIFGIDFSFYKNCCVKVIVVNKTNYSTFDNFIDNLYQQDLIELKIIEDLSEFEDEAIGEDVDLEDTMTLLKEYVDSIEVNLNKEKLKTLLQSLYVEAQDVV